VLRRDEIADELKALNQAGRAELRQFGVRFGAFNVYIPALLKPAAAELLCLLWTLHSGAAHNITVNALPERPRQGLTSVQASPGVPDHYWRALGFQPAGDRIVRIDMLERLADLIRTRVAFRGNESPEMPPGATGDGGFRVVPDMMSVVGCSGEDFASILKSLGFRRERHPVKRPQVGVASIGETGGAEGAAPTEPVIDEIWRPRKRQHGRDHRPDTRQRGRTKREPDKRPQAQPRKPRKDRTVANEHSPFAALAGLRQSLTARKPDDI
jgi:ATP-dependent RNA helicase SUPV3L1/SUV3